jgi:hypothetical protein
MQVVRDVLDVRRQAAAARHPVARLRRRLNGSGVDAFAIESFASNADDGSALRSAAESVASSSSERSRSTSAATAARVSRTTPRLAGGAFITSVGLSTPSRSCFAVATALLAPPFPPLRVIRTPSRSVRRAAGCTRRE